MRFSSFGLLAGLAAALTLVGGCKKSTPEEHPQPARQDQADSKAPTPGPTKTVARVHWLGMKRILEDTNAAALKPILNLPETTRLLNQTFDKLAIGLAAPEQLPMPTYREAVTNYHSLLVSNALASFLRPLFDDLLREEWFVEIRGATNRVGEIALAIRLSGEGHALWETNIAGAVESLTGDPLTGAKVATNNWEVVVRRGVKATTNHLRLERTGGWTLLGVAAGREILLTEFISRIEATRLPWVSQQSNSWLQADIDPSSVLPMAGYDWRMPEGMPRFSLQVRGDSSNVLMHGTCNFSSPLQIKPAPWNVPTNLIFGPLVGLTAVRNLQPLLSSLSVWKELCSGAAPDQVFIWSQNASPLSYFAAMPVPQASNVVERLASRLIKAGNPLIASNRMGHLERATNYNGLHWVTIPITEPFLQSVNLEAGQFVFAGLTPNKITNAPPPPETLRALHAKDNVLYFDREVTGIRVEAWMHISQLFRVLFRRVQMPVDSAVVSWYKAASPLLGPSRTEIARTGPSELTFERSSGLGLTAVELAFLGDWLESPKFPRGLYTKFMKLPPLPPPRTGTNQF